MKTKPRLNPNNKVVFAGDVILTIATILISFALRLEGAFFFYYLPVAYWMIGISLLVKPFIYYAFGLYRRLWAYASTRELILISYAVTVASGLLSVLTIFLYSIHVIQPGLPRSVLIIDWLLSIIAIGGFRMTLRLVSENKGPVAGVFKNGKLKHVLIIGAGDAGALVVREMHKNPQLNLSPIGYLDDAPEKHKHQIHGVKVMGPLADLGKVLSTRHIDEVIIAIPSAGGDIVRQVSDICRLKGVAFRTMPGIFELIGGNVSVNRLREVDITDLLRRQPALLDTGLIGSTLMNKRILVTGAGGSIGRELCRQIARWQPSELILLGHGENSIFEALLELHDNHPSLPIHPVIADIRDQPRIQQVFSTFKPQVVFHAAAHKHVPLMEANIEDAVSNNIVGTRYVVEAATSIQVERLVMISTDKAIRPINVMGATKRLAEMIVLNAAHRSNSTFSVVRFGNVLGSRGSVVPRFKDQISKGGPITITHPDMMRYFMTIPEAVHLVLQAASMGKGGEVFLLNMGKPVKILDLAEDLIRLSGLKPGKDIEIVFTGIRPGEKLSEDLWEDGLNYQHTSHSEIFRLSEEELILDDSLAPTIDRIGELLRSGDKTAILDLLDSAIPTAKIKVDPLPDLTSVV